MRAILEAEGAKAIGADHVIYELGADDVAARQLGGCQTRVLNAIRRLPGTVFLHYDENPQEWELGEWSSPAPNVWELPVDFGSGALLEDFLEAGNWRLYVGRESLPADAPTDVVKGDVAGLTELLVSCGIAVLVDAWHDNTEWRIVITATPDPEVVAA